MITIREDIQKILQERWEQPEVFEAALPTSTLDFLRTLEKNNPQVKTLNYRVYGLDTAPAIKVLYPKLKSILKFPFKVTGGNFFRTTIPYRLHADTSIDQNAKNYRIVVVPLAVETDGEYIQSENLFAVMNQRWYQQAAFFMKGEEEMFAVKKMEYNQPISDYSDIYNPSTSPFDPELHSKYFSHLKYENFERMSLLSLIQWRVGDILTFDRSNIHCAANFFNANVKTKIALSLFTEYTDI